MSEETIIVGEITAWRIWLVGSGPYLCSTFVPKAWFPDEVMTGNIELIGYGGIREGVYSWKSKDKALRYGGGHISKIVIGKVHIWGDVFEHERGYRSQYAKVIEINDVLTPWGKSTKRCKEIKEILCKDYNVVNGKDISIIDRFKLLRATITNFGLILLGSVIITISIISIIPVVLIILHALKIRL